MTKSGRPPSRGRSAGHELSLWPYVLAASVLLAIVGFLVVSHNSSTSPSPSSKGGAPGERGLPVGAAVPTQSLQSTDGTSISLDQTKGSKVVVYFYESSG